MLTLEDCIAFSGLTSDQLDAVAHHWPCAAGWRRAVAEFEGGH